MEVLRPPTGRNTITPRTLRTATTLDVSLNVYYLRDTPARPGAPGNSRSGRKTLHTLLRTRRKCTSTRVGRTFERCRRGHRPVKPVRIRVDINLQDSLKVSGTSDRQDASWVIGLVLLEQGAIETEHARSYQYVGQGITAETWALT
jgi:hypothetical protein